MNYDHAFHAGNFADVVKHIILARILAYLERKPAPFRVIDTHAGAGRYDLTGRAAEKSPEWREGIGRVLDADLPNDVGDLIAPYLDAVRGLNPGGQLTAYPGSPLLAKRLMRPIDRLTAMELHPQAGGGAQGAVRRRQPSQGAGGRRLSGPAGAIAAQTDPGAHPHRPRPLRKRASSPACSGR